MQPRAPTLSTEVQGVIDAVLAYAGRAAAAGNSLVHAPAVTAGLGVVGWLQETGLALLSDEYDAATGNNVLHLLARAGNASVMRQLRTVLGGALSSDARNRAGATPLALACTGGHLEVVDELIHGWCADVTVADRSGWAGIHIAAHVGHATLVASLCHYAPACVRLRTLTNATPLFLAAQEGHTDVCRVLVAAGAALTSERRDGSSTLFIACQEGHLEVARFLLQEAGANVNEATRSGSTPLHAAAVQVPSRSSFPPTAVASPIMEA